MQLGHRTVARLGGAILAVLLLSFGALVLVSPSNDGPIDTITARGKAPNVMVVAVGEALIGILARYPLPAEVLRSRNAGRTWDEVSLPGAAGVLEHASLAKYGDVVVVAASTKASVPPRGVEATSHAFVWTSVDGAQWDGPLLMQGTTGVGMPRVGSAAETLVTAATFGNEFVAFTSADRGASWRRSAVARLPLGPNETASLYETWSPADGALHATVSFYGTANPARDGRMALVTSTDDGATWAFEDFCPHQGNPACWPLVRSNTLLARGLETSTNGGQDWVPAAFDGPFERAIRFTSVEALPDGGSLATVEGFSGGGGGPLGWVVRSDDGVRWKPVLGPGADSCNPMPADDDTPGNVVSPLFRVGDRWYVSFSCPQRGSGLYAAEQEGRVFRVVAQDAYVATPFRWQDVLAVPAFDKKGRLRILVVRR